MGNIILVVITRSYKYDGMAAYYLILYSLVKLNLAFIQAAEDGLSS